MRDRRVRLVFVALVLALPLLIVAGAAGAPGVGPDVQGTELLSQVGAVEAVLVVGLLYASRQRRSLRSRRGAAVELKTPRALVIPAPVRPVPVVVRVHSTMSRGR